MRRSKTTGDNRIECRARSCCDVILLHFMQDHRPWNTVLVLYMMPFDGRGEIELPNVPWLSAQSDEG